MHDFLAIFGIFVGFFCTTTATRMVRWISVSRDKFPIPFTLYYLWFIAVVCTFCIICTSMVACNYHRNIQFTCNSAIKTDWLPTQVINLREHVNPSPWKPEMQVHLDVSLVRVFLTVQ